MREPSGGNLIDPLIDVDDPPHLPARPGGPPGVSPPRWDLRVGS